MPHIRVRGMAFEDLEYISEPLIKAISHYLNIPALHFTLEYQAITYLAAGGASTAYPFFDVSWFERTQEQKEEVARIITELVTPNIAPDTDICVLFHTMQSDDYFYKKGTTS
ncbi:pseudouridine synthase [Marinomonas sp. S3726]|uniref:DUF1904 family protein n=1 Tax=Marinomonas sp. S3726 TaxID=579484 RepID=UPI0005FA3C51|nr:DUF1904 family protein [Marinomonas sp. S3726]KJZ15991.1 pseudouridine synthase [Marinomonas sp. S3726]